MARDTRATPEAMVEWAHHYYACQEGIDWALASCSSMDEVWDTIDEEMFAWMCMLPGVLSEDDYRRFCLACGERLLADGHEAVVRAHALLAEELSQEEAVEGLEQHIEIVNLTVNWTNVHVNAQRFVELLKDSDGLSWLVQWFRDNCTPCWDLAPFGSL